MSGRRYLEAELRDYLQEKLPAYMIPSSFVIMDELPISPNGKVNRRMLPIPNLDRAALPVSFAPPQTPTEVTLAAIWTEVLDIKRIGLYDNFFQLGGHSLSATQIISRVHTMFEVELPFRKFFESPTIAELAEWIDEACLNRQSLPSLPLQQVEQETGISLSLAQERLWFLDQLDPGVAAYNLPAVLRLRGVLKIDVLQRGLTEMIRRHEILRTTFDSIDGRPTQIIKTAVSQTFPVIDLGMLSDTEQASKVKKLISEEIGRPFDLVEGPLLRISLLRLTQSEHIALFVMHHIIGDGWSIGILIKELTVLYEAYLHDAPSPLPELPVQYADFARWQRRQWLEKGALDRQRTYWKKQLTDVSALNLPFDRARPAVQTFSGAIHAFKISQHSLRHLSAFIHEEGATPFMVLLAVFKTLLYRYTLQSDIVVGTPIAGRTQPEAEKLIGFFVNTLVLRTMLSGKMSFRQLVKQIRVTTVNAYENQDLPFARLVEELQLERDLSRSPLFQVFFTLQNAPMSTLEFSGLTVEPLEVDNNTAQFDLSLYLSETDDGLEGVWEYNTDLFDTSTIVKMSDRFQMLLESVALNLDRPLLNLPFLTELEEHQLLVAWNQTMTQRSESACLTDLVEAQVLKTPNAVAVTIPTINAESGFEHCLTFADLNQRANCLASYLRTFGVGPEVPVGIYIDRSLEMMISLLGVLKAGGVYVPLDPSLPPNRLAFMLEDAGIKNLLSQENLRKNVTTPQIRVLCLDTDWTTIAQQSNQNPTKLITADNLAYIMYTSGSTGQPKGVQISHRSVINLLRAIEEKVPLTNDDILLAITRLSFDIAGLELFLPLIAGMRLAIATAEISADGIQLAEMLATTQTTIMQATPATWRLLLLAEWPGNYQLKMLCGGDSLSRELANELVTKGASLWNVYGPTETTIWSTIDKVSLEEASISIGRPLANTQLYILDAHLQPVPIGVFGDLYIAGDGLARGYLNRAGLTAETFIPNPFNQAFGRHLYKTGDIACYQQDGRIQFKGRNDHQVKIRGHRIELEEIETVLEQHPVVSAAVVVADGAEQTLSDKHLVACIVPDWSQTSNDLSKEMAFSLFYFAADDTGIADDKYKLYIEGAKFADRHNFTAVWTPERHFHHVAGLYPNPATLNAALAMVTKEVQLRAGSVVLPLHHPIRVAEEWAVVDNLSQGRVGLAFASGWVPNDFAFFPENFENKREIMLDSLQKVKALWRGEAITVRDGVNNQTAVKIFPRPIQPELPVWLTCTDHPSMFKKAGEMGVNVLTALLSQSIEDAAENIALYRQSLHQNGHDPETGHVTMMLHTFIGPDAVEKAREPFCHYMKSHVGLIETLVKSLDMQIDFNKENELNDLVAYAFERYTQSAALIGDTETCIHMVRRLKEIGVDEIACLIDFGIEFDTVMTGLYQLNNLKEMSKKIVTSNISNSILSFLKENLPNYMLPTDIVTLDSLPLTANKKVDRQRLMKTIQSQPKQRSQFVPPRTPIEKELAQIWVDILRVERVSIHDDFFSLGGHSLMATRLIARVRLQFAVSLSIRDLFTAPTVAGMANLIEEALLSQADLDKVDELLDAIEHLDESDVERILTRENEKLHIS